MFGRRVALSHKHCQRVARLGLLPRITLAVDDPTIFEAKSCVLLLGAQGAVSEEFDMLLMGIPPRFLTRQGWKILSLKSFIAGLVSEHYILVD